MGRKSQKDVIIQSVKHPRKKCFVVIITSRLLDHFTLLQR